jgi:predicted nuclease of restriction endonuclease-like (RecB) superfamily
VWSDADKSVQQLVGQLPWGHHLILVAKVTDASIREWYASQAVEHGWSRAVLVAQIESRLHKRAGKALTNFKTTLPPSQSDLAHETLKDPYVFDFLTLGPDAHERELEQGLIDHVQRFLMELGVGFAFVGRQVHIEVADEDFYVDLLLYHLKLRCFVVIDLKAVAFRPEFAGKMNFYLSAVDAQMRHPDDGPSKHWAASLQREERARRRVCAARRAQADRRGAVGDAHRRVVAQGAEGQPADRRGARGRARAEAPTTDVRHRPTATRQIYPGRPTTCRGL